MAHTHADIPIIIFVYYSDCYITVFGTADISSMVFTVAKAVCYAVSHDIGSSAPTAHADCFSVISSVVIIAFVTAFVHT